MPQDVVKDLVAPPGAFRAPLEYSDAPVRDDWLASFNDAALSGLIDEALAQNPNLASAAAVRDQAMASVRLARSTLLPRIGALGGISRDEGSTRFEELVSLELQASWEIDLWGRQRASVDAAQRDAQATALEYAFLRQSLAALVAQAWFSAIVAGEQVAIDRERLMTESSTAEATARRSAAGVGTPIDDDFAQANVATAREALAASEYAFEESVRALEILLGRYPGAELSVAFSLPDLPASPPIGLPADLLQRRPDLVSAEERVAAAFLRTESRRLARLPSVTIGASAGVLFNPAEEVWSIAAQVFAPLFTGGEIDAQIEIASAQQRQAMADYIALAIDAFAEAESSLAAARFLDRRAEELGTAVARFASANRIAEERYEAGVLTIFELNQVRQDYFNARSRQLVVRLEQYLRRIDLHLALGGSFDDRSALDHADGPGVGPGYGRERSPGQEQPQ
ncbi:MAG: efflux transporter outer membrane subunit [Phycisphaerales bacterium]|nr:efflux transporter outer membrane subunit [Phycisphaerales bacterium]